MIKLKSLLALSLSALITVLTLPINTLALTKDKTITPNPTTIELMNNFPQFKESLNSNTTGILVSNTESYIKYTLKENSTPQNEYKNYSEIKNDFYIEQYTKENYLKELNTKPKRLRRSIGDQEGPSCNWLKITLQVYNSSNANEDYMVYNFSSWLTKPAFRFTDGIGISVSNGMLISPNRHTRSAVYNYDVFGEPKSTSLGVEINENGNGVLAKFDLCPSGYQDSNKHNDAMIQTGVCFSSSNKGRISGHYIHKQLVFGSIGMDGKGIPSLSVSLGQDSHSQSIYVEK